MTFFASGIGVQDMFTVSADAVPTYLTLAPVTLRLRLPQLGDIIAQGSSLTTEIRISLA